MAEPHTLSVLGARALGSGNVVGTSSAWQLPRAPLSTVMNLALKQTQTPRLLGWGFRPDK